MIKTMLFGLLMLITGLSSFSQIKLADAGTVNDGPAERQYFISMLTRIADPVLNALSKNELKLKMPVEAGEPDKRK